jgi:hypothetical protein
MLSLIRHLIFRAFRDAFPDRVPESFSPLRFFSAKPEHDAVKNFLPEELHEQISYPRMVEVEARQITEDAKPSFGLLSEVVNVGNSTSIFTTFSNRNLILSGKAF